ncbi:MAG: hypothetical protein PUF12_04865 [Thermoflexaceae bacterium]|nr:hypothetical protein [Thermoflexaceae bacterium]
MKIVITARDFATFDRHAIELLYNAGHQVMDLGEKGFGCGTCDAEIIKNVGDADIVIAGLEPYNRNVINHCKNLQMISRRGIGYDSVELDACKERNITVTRTVGAVEGAVNE